MSDDTVEPLSDDEIRAWREQMLKGARDAHTLQNATHDPDVDTGHAWSQADDVVDYPPTGADELGEVMAEPTGAWLRAHRKSWWTAIGSAAIILLVAVAAMVWIVFLLSSPSKPHYQTLPPSSSAAPTPEAAPTSHPPAKPDVLIADAFTETIDGKTVLALEPLTNVQTGGYGTAEHPYLRLLGVPSQRQDVIDKLAKLGINLDENSTGVVATVGFHDVPGGPTKEQAQMNWADWWSKYTNSQPPPVAVVKPLDGTYRLDFSNDWHDHIWMGFRSACTATGCTATGTLLKSADLQPLTPQPDWILHWINGRWQQINDAACTLLEPQTDGTYRGTICGADSNRPFTATRTGPPPPGLADPPTR